MVDATCTIPSTLNAFLFLPSFLPPCLSFLLPCIGLSHLVGTNLLRGYMHGYFMDIRLYHKVSFPFVGRLVYILFSNMELHPLPPLFNFPLTAYVYYILLLYPSLPSSFHLPPLLLNPSSITRTHTMTLSLRQRQFHSHLHTESTERRR